MAGWSSWPERFGFAQEPGAGGLVAVEIDPEADPSLERSRRAPRTAPGRRWTPRSARAGSARPSAARVRSNASDRIGARSRGRQSPAPLDSARSGRTAAASHQRRLPVGESSVKKSEQRLAGAAADRRAPARRGWRAADRAIASSGARAGGPARSRSRHSPATRVSCWRPAAPGQLLVERGDRLRRAAARPSCSASASSVSRARSSSTRANDAAVAGGVEVVERAPAREGRRRRAGDRVARAMRPRALLTKSSQSASPRRVNSSRAMGALAVRDLDGVAPGRAWPCTAPCRPRRAGC